MKCEIVWKHGQPYVRVHFPEQTRKHQKKAKP